MMSDHYVWLVWALTFLIPWGIVYVVSPAYRDVMLRASLLTMFFGLTEPLFVPEYWHPPSLFNLASMTGFDIESLIFCFGIGGIGAVSYNVLTGQALQPMSLKARQKPLHRHHMLAITTPFILFPLLMPLPLNPIYPAILAMIAGGVANSRCRPDLTIKSFWGSTIFLIYYLLFVAGLELMAPGYIERVWNLDALSGLFVFAIPIEELLFASSFGYYWIGIYEHLTWRQSVPKTNV